MLYNKNNILKILMVWVFIPLPPHIPCGQSIAPGKGERKMPFGKKARMQSREVDVPNKMGKLKKKASGSQRKSMEQKCREQTVRPVGSAPPRTLDRNPGMGQSWALEILGGNWAGRLYYSTLHGELQEVTPIPGITVPV